MHRRIDVTKLPFIGRQLSIGMHVPLAGHQIQLPFGKIGIHQRKGDAVKGQIPGGIPGVLPFVGHGDNVKIVEMLPFVVASLAAGVRQRLHARVPVNPLLDIIVVKLFGPEHAGQGLTLDPFFIGAQIGILNGRVKFICFNPAVFKNPLKFFEGG